jgi:hypothetical protein
MGRGIFMMEFLMLFHFFIFDYLMTFDGYSIFDNGQQYAHNGRKMLIFALLSLPLAV